MYSSSASDELLSPENMSFMETGNETLAVACFLFLFFMTSEIYKLRRAFYLDTFGEASLLNIAVVLFVSLNALEFELESLFLWLLLWYGVFSVWIFVGFNIELNL